MRKLNVGERVIVRKDLQSLVNNHESCVVPVMVEYAGMTVTIAKQITPRDRPTYEILEDDRTFLWEDNCFVRLSMQKSDLNTGDICKTKDGSSYVVLKNVITEVFSGDCFVKVNGNGWLKLENYDDDLKNCFSENYDIEEIYRCGYPHIIMSDEKNYDMKLLWKRNRKYEALEKASFDCGMNIELKR